MNPSIPASQIVTVNPQIISSGGSPLALNGLILSPSTRVPIGSVLSFPTSTAVTAYFGGNTDESDAAAAYFLGFDNSNIKPGAILFAQYNAAAVSAYLRSASVAALTLAQLQALSGNITITIDGYVHVAAVNLSAATSFSSAASIIQTALDLPVVVTGAVAANVVTGSIAVNAITASIAGTTMTVTAVATGCLAAGQTVTGTNVAAGTTIVSQLTGATPGGTGTYQVSVSQTVTSASLATTGGGLTVTAVTTGTLAVGQTITGAGVAANTTITALGSGTGGTGTYAVSTAQTVVSTTITASGGTLNVSAVTTGILGIGDVISGTGITTGNKITAFLTGTGGTGTYLVSVGDTAVSTTITVVGAGPTVVYDSVSGGFVITSTLTGAASTIGYASGAIATSLKMTLATGAVLSQGAAGTNPSAAMTAITNLTQNLATFMTTFDPDNGVGNTNKLAFAAWTNAQNLRYMYVCWDTDITPTLSNNAAGSLGNILTANNSNGTVPIYAPTYDKAAMVCGMAASIDFTQTNGRITFDFKAQSGQAADVTDPTVAANLIANGYNFYGAYATANQGFTFFTPGSVTGSYKWADSYINQIWLNNAFQLALMILLTNTKSVPYDALGYGLERAALLDPITQAGVFGVYGEGIPLSALQAAEVNAAAGTAIDKTLSSQGYYLQILPATAQVRGLRQSNPLNFWYMDAGSIQKINLASIAVQ
jgi:hypothetical protein